MAWLLENVAALSQQTDGRIGAGAGARLDIAASRARERRVELSRALARIATGDLEAESDIAAARGDTASPQGVLDSLRALITSGASWLAKRDAESVALCESVHLGQADLDAAAAAADALASALAAKITTGVERAGDGPATNRIEGRVTYEMAVAKGAFDQAADAGIGERLTPGPATRGLFGSGSKKKPAASAAVASAPSSGNGASASA